METRYHRKADVDVEHVLSLTRKAVSSSTDGAN
jgi:hypothetical protein